MAISVMQFFGGALLILVLAAIVKMVFQGEMNNPRNWSVRTSGDDAGTIYTGQSRKIHGDQLLFFRLDGSETVPVPISHQGEVVIGRRELDRGNRTISRQQFIIVRNGESGVLFQLAGGNPVSLLSPEGSEVRLLPETFSLKYGETIYLKVGNRSYAVRLFREEAVRPMDDRSSPRKRPQPAPGKGSDQVRRGGTIVRRR